MGFDFSNGTFDFRNLSRLISQMTVMLPGNKLILRKKGKKEREGCFNKQKIMVPVSALKYLWSSITRVLRVVRNGFQHFTLL